jgi:transposase
MGRRRSLPENDHHRVIGMADAGMNIAAIAVQFNVHKTTVYRLISRYRQIGSVDNRPRPVRPKKLTPHKERYIHMTSRRERFLSATCIADRLRTVFGTRVSAETICNRLRSQGLKVRRPHKGMELTVHHKLQRRRWVNQRLNWNIRKWQSVLFSDESRFSLKFADGRI